MRLAFVAIVAVVAAGCDASPLAVQSDQPGASAGLPGGPPVGGLLSCSALPRDSATVVVGSEGGILQVGPHVLSVPAGALDGPVAITAVLVPEPVNRVRFAPAGLAFREAASLTMSYANCGVLATLWPKQIAYVEDDDGGLAILELIASTDDLLARRVTGGITHFSSYAIAW